MGFKSLVVEIKEELVKELREEYLKFIILPLCLYLLEKYNKDVKM